MKKKICKPDWKAILVLGSSPILALIFIPWYEIKYGFTYLDWIVFGIFMTLTGVSITAGYHRLWSHKAYKTNYFFRLLFMIFGSASLQNSVFKWASEHRRHHIFVDDKEKDPYAATNGFLYSHITWMLFKHKSSKIDFSNIKDLQKDSILRFQHKYYALIALATCFGLPALIGWTYGSIIGCLLLAGLLRVVLNHHLTFFINSIAHIFGTRPYTEENSARDNPFISLVTYGEGYHNFHHKFSGDYRNGVHWYDFDPSKWLISMCNKAGWTWDIKITPNPIIESAKLQTQYTKAQKKLIKRPSQLNLLKQKIETQHQSFSKSLSDWSKSNSDWIEAKKTALSTERTLVLQQKYIDIRQNVENEKLIWTKLFQQLKYKQEIND